MGAHTPAAEGLVYSNGTGIYGKRFLTSSVFVAPYLSYEQGIYVPVRSSPLDYNSFSPVVGQIWRCFVFECSVASFFRLSFQNFHRKLEECLLGAAKTSIATCWALCIVSVVNRYTVYLLRSQQHFVQRSMIGSALLFAFFMSAFGFGRIWLLYCCISGTSSRTQIRNDRQETAGLCWRAAICERALHPPPPPVACCHQVVQLARYGSACAIVRQRLPAPVVSNADTSTVIYNRSVPKLKTVTLLFTNITWSTHLW